MELTAFERLIQEAFMSIGVDGDLPRAWRLRLRLALIDSADNPVDGAQRWVALEARCARHTWPVWCARFPDDNRPVLLLGEAEAASQSESGRQVALQHFETVKTLLDGLFDLGDEYFDAIYAGFSCWAAARAALFQSSDLVAATELEVDPELWDSCFYSSLAASGGATWEDGDGDANLRRRFWEWFLVTALPEAASAGR